MQHLCCEVICQRCGVACHSFSGCPLRSANKMACCCIALAPCAPCSDASPPLSHPPLQHLQDDSSNQRSTICLRQLQRLPLVQSRQNGLLLLCAWPLSTLLRWHILSE